MFNFYKDLNKLIDYNQLDHVNKWQCIIGGLLITIPKSIIYLLKKTRSEST